MKTVYSRDPVRLLCLSIQLDKSFYVDQEVFNFVWMTCISSVYVDSFIVYKQKFEIRDRNFLHRNLRPVAL